MERLTKRIGQHVYYTQGKYEDTLPVEMETNDIRSVLKKLAEYEDLEEQGLLLRLPVVEGSTVWKLQSYSDCEYGHECYKCEKNNLTCGYEFEVCRVVKRNFRLEMLPFIGISCFLTKEEAEQAMERMEKENG